MNRASSSARQQPELLVSHSVKAARAAAAIAPHRRHTNNLAPRRAALGLKLMREDSHIDLVAELTSSTDIQFGILRTLIQI